jgi:hypothetical protein
MFDFVGRKQKESRLAASGAQPDPRAFDNGAALPNGIIKSPENFCTHDYTLADPMDIRAADELLHKLIMDERRAMDPEGTLYVVMGEDHTMAAHKMLQAGAVESIGTAYRQTGEEVLRPCLMIEAPFNVLASYAKDIYDLPVSDQQIYGLHALDPSGHVLARAVIANNNYANAPNSVSQRLATALRHTVPVVPVDVAERDGNEDGFEPIDPQDTLAAELARTMFKISMATREIEKTASQGMQIRNMTMARRIAAAARYHKTGIALIAGGNQHLGDKEDGLPFETSLPAFLAKTTTPKDRIVSIFTASARDGYTPENFMPRGSHPKVTPVVLRGLADNAFDMPWLVSKENAFIARLGQSYGENMPERFHPLPPSNLEASKREIEALLAQIPG